ncbi:hypothetical protein CH339_04880 [Rhodobium orientis]|uniref:Uncharacterized protein n=2 Tax=Rhodobium orientis TaxID=34017 RepID=A0A327JRB5_9HYPH|nr:hypothetical protein [Rhodobium orientis]RAI29020.1 hypothetical protein CH339_04880 [Rhodobium orientis]
MGDRGALQFGRCLAACVTQAKNLERARVSEQVLTEDHLKDPAIAQFPVVARPHPKHGGDAA